MCKNQELCWHFEGLPVRKSADYKIPLKRARYSEKAVSNFNRTVTGF